MPTSAESIPTHEIVTVAPFTDPSLWDDSAKAIHYQCYVIRKIVYCEEQGFPPGDPQFDDLDAVSATFLLRLVPSLEPVGTIRGVRHPDGYYKLTRMLVLLPYRKYSFGRELIETMHAWMRSDASANLLYAKRELEILCNSQLHAREFYAKFGYVAEGPEFMICGQLHQRMVARLPLS